MPPKTNDRKQPLEQEQQPQDASRRLQCYAGVLRSSTETLLKSQMPVVERLSRILLGIEHAPANPNCANDEAQIASIKRQNIFVAVGHAFIEKYAAEYILAEEDAEDNNTNQLPSRRDRKEGEKSISDTSSSNSEQQATESPTQQRTISSLGLMRVRGALALSAVLVDRVFNPNERRGFGSMIAVTTDELVTLHPSIDDALGSCKSFLDRLFTAIDNNRFTEPLPAETLDHAAFVADLLVNLPLPPPRNDINVRSPFRDNYISDSLRRADNIFDIRKEFKLPEVSPGDLTDLHQIFAQYKNGAEKQLKENFVSYSASRTFAGRVVRQTTYDATYPYRLAGPDLILFVEGNETSTGRIAFIDITAAKGEQWHPWCNDYRMQDRLATELCNNPCRRFMYGLIANGACARLYRAETDQGSSFKVTYKMCYECKNSLDCVIKCFHFLLYSDFHDALGFVDYPTISFKNSKNSNNNCINTAGASFTLGCVLGEGESCRTYGFVRPEFHDGTKDENGITKMARADDCEHAFVVKMFPSSDGAERESKFYDLLEKHGIRGTTRIFRGAKLTGKLPQTDGRMLVVTPRAETFRVALRDGSGGFIPNEPDVQQITQDHVAQLVEALRSLHLIGVVHGDIQHQNLFYDSGNPSRAMLNDFGRSRLITSMSFSEFRAHMLRDWKMLEAALTKPVTGGTLYMAYGVDAWNKFWESNSLAQNRTKNDCSDQ